MVKLFRAELLTVEPKFWLKKATDEELLLSKYKCHLINSKS